VHLRVPGGGLAHGRALGLVGLGLGHLLLASFGRGLAGLGASGVFLSDGRQLRVLDRGRGVHFGELDLVYAGHQGAGRGVRVPDSGSTFVSGARFY
jgi:hypothetical protein